MHFDQCWENKTLDYDILKYPWPSQVLSVIQEKFPLVDDLTRVHKHLTASQIQDLTIHVQSAFGRQMFAQQFDQFAEEYIQPLLGGKKYLIKRQATLNCVIPNQQHVSRKLPFHQGVFYNNGRGQRTIWMALTDCEDTNSMWIADTESSQRLTKQCIDQKMNQDQFESECVKICKPVNIKPGQCHLFHQEHIHGNVNNETGYTRMAVDWHVLIEGEEYGGRLPGGFFRAPGDYEQQQSFDHSNQNIIAYVGNNTHFDKHIPVHFQRKVIDEYCQHKQISCVAVQFENEHLEWLPVLEQCIKQKPDGIVMCSMYSLPDDIVRRNEILKVALHNNVKLYFANEHCCMTNINELHKIQMYIDFAVQHKGSQSWETS